METRCAEDSREVDFANYFQQINGAEDKWLVAGFKAVQSLCALLKDTLRISLRCVLSFE